MRECSTCKEAKDATQFAPRKQARDGVSKQCRTCIAIKSKAYKNSNTHRLREAQKAYYAENLEHIKNRQARYYKENQEKLISYSARWREGNPDKVAEYRSRYYQINKDVLSEKRRARYAASDKTKERSRRRDYYLKNVGRNNNNCNAYAKWRKRIDPVFALSCSLRSRVSGLLAKRELKKSSKIEHILGCSFEQLKGHLEAQFAEGMSWANRNQWHIDHIIPLASAKSVTDVVKLNHYSNLQPLWAKDNLAKGAQLP